MTERKITIEDTPDEPKPDVEIDVTVEAPEKDDNDKEDEA